MKVLIAGTGFAAEGHAAAFRAAGAEITGIVGRTPSVVAELAQRLEIPYAGTDWASALKACRPDIASIATPGGAHHDQITQAIDAGCHVFCDKPLTITGESARELADHAARAGVKTAYAASFRYTPSVQHAARLVAEGAIGEPTEVECISHFNLERGIPFGWSHRAEQGGGRLNNNFTHTLSIVTAVVGEQITQITGDLRDDMHRAPIVDGVHNFATRREFIPEDLSAPALDWGDSNVEWSYTVLARIDSPLAAQPVSVLFKHGGLVPRFGDDHIVFYGTKGAVHLKGHYGSGQVSLYGADRDWRALPLPDDIASTLPKVAGETELCWHILARDFVRDLSGEPAAPYPTFREGAQYQQIIDLLRVGAPWISAPKL
ncbi:Gfo/Idh/MocA family oxidoreductase [Salipiger sp. 1_MG-2023]|uniref:Gfo/Idh/MocA family protein n=1 Tax=Salipiger sp. 1_MG-2023 TaxID=3062665 RepID=UPI0026E3191A|nr:Gfo/Idh/MocA family oxidoreductase [Salipiger sp. 1_MG-2023]MDO6586946.1 Gfo/Idh/MocA family oxidoreductase [Salipiger sp. 1_MG-2023]